MVALSSLCLIIPLVMQYAQGQLKPVIWAPTNIFQEGQNVSLKCIAISSSKQTFLWTHPPHIKKFQRIEGQKKIDEKLMEFSNTFTFIARRLDNARKFTCTVNYDGNSIPTDPYMIYVFLIPFVPLLKGPNYVIEKSGRHTWTCEVYGGSITPARVYFKHNGETQQGEISTHVITTHAEHRHWLYKKIVNITMRIPDDVSSYNLECEFISDFANFYIVQSGAMEIIVLWTKPRTFPPATAMLAYMANSKIYLNCTYRSFGVDYMRWDTDYVRLSSGTFINGTYTEEGATVFWLANIFVVTAFDNDRNFTCVVSKNGNEQIKADPIKILIYSPPYIKSLETVNASSEGEIEQATCIVSNASFVMPEIVWSDEFGTVLSNDIVETPKYETISNNILLYEITSTINITMERKVRQTLTCSMYHHMNDQFTTDNKTVHIYIAWTGPIVVPSTHQPYYVDQGQMLTLNCSINFGWYLNMTWSMDYNISGNFDSSPEVTFECYPNCVFLFWVTFTFEATALTNQRNFQCWIFAEEQNISSEVLLVQTFMHTSKPQLDGPNDVKANVNNTWTCRSYGGSITVPKVTWMANGGDIITHSIITSVYVTEVDNYNYVYQVYSNLTYSPKPSINNSMDLFCVLFHSVAHLSYREEASKIIEITAQSSRTFKSTNDGSQISGHFVLVFMWTSIVTVTWASIFAVEFSSMNNG